MTLRYNPTEADGRTEADAILEFATDAAAAAAELTDLGDGRYLRRDGEVIDIEQHLAAPRRVKARPMFTRPGSFAAYLSRHSSTEPWQRWQKSASGWLTQEQLVDLLEVASLAASAEVADPEPNELTTLVASLTATMTSSLRTADVGDGGNRSLSYEETAKVRGKGGVELPQRLTVVLQPFEGVEHASTLTVRLHVRAVTGEPPKFRLAILRAEQAIASAIEFVTDLVHDEVPELTAYAGRP